MTSEPLGPGAQRPRRSVTASSRSGAACPSCSIRDGAGEQAVYELADDRERVTIGRRAANDIALPWDHEVSRVHAELTRMGGDWVVCDEGISHNGTFVNGERVRGRRLLRGGDVIAVGDTQLAFCAAVGRSTIATRTAGERAAGDRADRRRSGACSRRCAARCRAGLRGARVQPADRGRARALGRDGQGDADRAVRALRARGAPAEPEARRAGRPRARATSISGRRSA